MYSRSYDISVTVLFSSCKVTPLIIIGSFVTLLIRCCIMWCILRKQNHCYSLFCNMDKRACMTCLFQIYTKWCTTLLLEGKIPESFFLTIINNMLMSKIPTDIKLKHLTLNKVYFTSPTIKEKRAVLKIIQVADQS